MLFVTVTEAVLYFCFCILGGSLIFYSIKDTHRPDINIPKRWLLISSMGAGILSFAPILYLILTLGRDTGYWDSFIGVLFTFQVGKAWVFNLVIALLLFALIYFNRLDSDIFLSRMGLLLFICLIIAYTKAGHAASLMPVLGFGAHFLHLLAVSLWGGCLICAAWFSKSTSGWRNYLRWFTPFAVISMIVLLLAGFATMMIDIAKPLDHSLSSTFHQYKQGLIMNYGQALVMKHLLIIPLLLLAFFNGFYTKKLKTAESLDAYHPIKWARVESVIVFFIFIVTAFMGQQSPPHDVSQSILVGQASPLFTSLYNGNLSTHTILHFSLSWTSSAFFILAIILLLMTALFIIKKGSGFLAVVLSVGFLLSSYFGIMSGMQ